MANIAKNQLVEHLNALKTGGATEKQLRQSIVAAGYKTKDFVTDLSGKYVISQNDIKTYDGTDQTAQVGGETKTVYILPTKKTTTSNQHGDDASFALKEAALFRINPNTSFGQKQLSLKLSAGEISYDFYNYLVNASPAEREAQYNNTIERYNQTLAKSKSAEVSQDSQTVLSGPTSYVSPPLQYVKTVSSSDTKVLGDIAEGGIKQTVINGVAYQVKSLGSGTQYTNEVSGESFVVPENVNNHSLVLGGGVNAPSFSATLTDTPADVTQEPSAPTPAQSYPVLSSPVPVTTDAGARLNATNDPRSTLYTGPSTVDEEPATDASGRLNAANDPRSTLYTGPSTVDEEPGTDNGTAASDTTTQDSSPGTGGGTTAASNPPQVSGTQDARSGAPVENLVPFPANPDYRVRVSLAPTANYLYKVEKSKAGILAPLQETNGVIFPYTPTINVTYTANYETTDLVHTNYKIYNYKNSSVETVNIVGTFTAQDTYEANYLLAVIHFFRSATKMFYGKDKNPIKGVPPPLVYLSGLGAYGFDNHPMVINNFSVVYPDDVDYIKAHPEGLNNRLLASYQPPIVKQNISGLRLALSKLLPGGKKMMPALPSMDSITSSPSMGDSGTTYTMVPTRMQINITCLPIVSRDDISNNFSLEEYATGKLLQGSKDRRRGGGIW